MFALLKFRKARRGCKVESRPIRIYTRAHTCGSNGFSDLICFSVSLVSNYIWAATVHVEERARGRRCGKKLFSMARAERELTRDDRAVEALRTLRDISARIFNKKGKTARIAPAGISKAAAGCCLFPLVSFSTPLLFFHHRRAPTLRPMCAFLPFNLLRASFSRHDRARDLLIQISKRLSALRLFLLAATNCLTALKS